MWQFRADWKRRKKYKKLDSICAFRLESTVYRAIDMWVAWISTFYRLTFKRLNDTKLQAITHAYVHRLADVHLAGFAPAFTLSLCDSEYARKPPVPIASVVRWHSKKRKKTDLLLKNLWRTVRFFSTFWLFCNDRIRWLSGFCSADNSSQIFEGRIGLLAFQTTTNNDRKFEYGGLTK